MRPDSQVVFDALCESLLCGEEDALVMVAQMYLDDSKDGQQKIAVVSAGLLGNRDQWRLLWALWKQRLQQDNLDYFKTTECRHLQGQFYKFRQLGKLSVGKDSAQGVRNDLEQIIRGTGVLALGLAIAMPDWDELRDLPGSRGFFARDPYESAFQSLMFESVKELRRVPGNHVVKFVHDEGDDFPRLHMVYKDFKEKNPKVIKYLGGFDPQDDKLTPPLQAADLIADQARQLASVWVANRQEISLEKLKACIPRVSVWDTPLLLKHLDYAKRKF